jgi:hypothetical protein
MNVSVRVPETLQGAQRESLFWTRRQMINFESFLNYLKFRRLDHKFILFITARFFCQPAVTLLLNPKSLAGLPAPCRNASTLYWCNSVNPSAFSALWFLRLTQQRISQLMKNHHNQRRGQSPTTYINNQFQLWVKVNVQSKETSLHPPGLIRTPVWSRRTGSKIRQQWTWVV